MKGLKSTLANLASLRGRFEKLLAGAANSGGPPAEFSARHLREVMIFGSNPGNLRMLTHMRRNLTDAPALVVALLDARKLQLTTIEDPAGPSWPTRMASLYCSPSRSAPTIPTIVSTGSFRATPAVVRAKSFPFSR
jgi:hypothetical protein